MEIAVALGELRPEFAGDFHDRLHLRAVHFDAVHLVASGGQRVEIILAPEMLVHLAEDVERVAQNLVALEFRLGPVRRALLDFERLAVFQILAQTVHRLAEHAIGFALLHFKRANLVDKIVEDVAHVHRIEHAEAEIDRELQARLAGRGLDSVAVLEQQHAEAIEAGIFQREAILGLIHAETARAAGARGEEDVVIEDVLARDAFLFEELQILHQVADREISRIALPVVAEFLAELEGRHVGHRQLFAAITAALEDGANQVLMLPGEAAKQNGDPAALFGREGALDRLVEMRVAIQAGELSQANPFRRETLGDFTILLNLYEWCRHGSSLKELCKQCERFFDCARSI